MPGIIYCSFVNNKSCFSLDEFDITPLERLFHNSNLIGLSDHTWSSHCRDLVCCHSSIHWNLFCRDFNYRPTKMNDFQTLICTINCCIECKRHFPPVTLTIWMCVIQERCSTSPLMKDLLKWISGQALNKWINNLFYLSR